MLVTKGLHDLTVYGEALISAGFEVRGAISGLGLVTRGLIWECPNIWVNSQSILTTGWTDAQAATTTDWTSAEDSISTTWLPCAGSPFAEC